MLLMEAQPIYRRQTLVACSRIVVIDLAQHLQHITAFIGKVRRHIHELSSTVREAVGQQNLHSGAQLPNIAGQRITHLDRRLHAGCAMFQYAGQILPGTLQFAEVQRGFPSGPLETTPVVNTPVRCSDGSRATRSMRMLVSSLCTTSPCAACRIDSSQAEHSRDLIHSVLRSQFSGSGPTTRPECDTFPGAPVSLIKTRLYFFNRQAGDFPPRYRCSSACLTATDTKLTLIQPRFHACLPKAHDETRIKTKLGTHSPG